MNLLNILIAFQTVVFLIFFFLALFNIVSTMYLLLAIVTLIYLKVEKIDKTLNPDE